jgi:hypothetical protein
MVAARFREAKISRQNDVGVYLATKIITRSSLNPRRMRASKPLPRVATTGDIRSRLPAVLLRPYGGGAEWAAKDRSRVARSHPTHEQENPNWGASPIHGELMLGFEMCRRSPPLISVWFRPRPTPVVRDGVLTSLDAGVGSMARSSPLWPATAGAVLHYAVAVVAVAAAVVAGLAADRLLRWPLCAAGSASRWSGHSIFGALPIFSTPSIKAMLPG